MVEYQNPLWSIFEGIRTALGQAGPVTVAAAAGVFGLIVLGSFATGWLFLAILVAHVGLTIAALTVLGMRVWPRFFFTDIALAMVLIVPGVSMIAHWVGRRVPGLIAPSRALGLAVVLMVVLSALLASRNYTAPKQDLVGAVSYVAEVRNGDEPVYAITYSADLFNRHFGTDWVRLTDAADYEAAITGPSNGVYVVTFPQRAFRLFPGLKDTDQFETLKRFRGTLGDGAILILRQK